MEVELGIRVTDCVKDDIRRVGYPSPCNLSSIYDSLSPSAYDFVSATHTTRLQDKGYNQTHLDFPLAGL